MDIEYHKVKALKYRNEYLLDSRYTNSVNFVNSKSETGK